MINPDFNKITYFLKVAEKQSISEAARELFISPQALNKQIALLEQELGEKLLLRTTRTMELTEFGRFFQAQMAPISQLFDIALKDTEYYLNMEERSCKVSFFQGMSKRRVVLPIINELMAEMPDVQMELHANEMDQVLEEVRSGKADLGISYLHEFEMISDLEQIVLLQVPASIVISYYHPWMVRETVTREDMAEMPVLYLERAHGPDKGGFYKELNPRSCRFSPSYNSMLARLETGKEYGVFPSEYENLDADGFRSLALPDEYAFQFSIVIFYRKENKYSEMIASLASLSEEIKNFR